MAFRLALLNHGSKKPGVNFFNRLSLSHSPFSNGASSTPSFRSVILSQREDTDCSMRDDMSTRTPATALWGSLTLDDIFARFNPDSPRSNSFSRAIENHAHGALTTSTSCHKLILHVLRHPIRLRSAFEWAAPFSHPPSSERARTHFLASENLRTRTIASE